jgi:hypothetical protein
MDRVWTPELARTLSSNSIVMRLPASLQLLPQRLVHSRLRDEDASWVTRWGLFLVRGLGHVFFSFSQGLLDVISMAVHCSFAGARLNLCSDDDNQSESSSKGYTTDACFIAVLVVPIDDNLRRYLIEQLHKPLVTII